MWPWNAALKYEELRQVTCDFRDWYFKQGGMYLSENARDAYFEVQKSINAILDQNPAGPVLHEHYMAIRDRCSTLRTELAKDLLTRREAPAVKAQSDG
jgi:hypothetical protein